MSFVPRFLAQNLAIRFKFFEARRKSATMSRVKPCIRRAVWLLVIYGMLCVLISPLQLHTAVSGKSMVGFFSLITCGLLDLFFLLVLLSSGFAGREVAYCVGVLDKICLRLC